MTEDGRDHIEIQKEMRSIAEASFVQAREAFENFLASVQQTAAKIEGQGATVRANAQDMSSKAISYAEKYVAASLDHAEQMLHAKDLTEVMRLHSEYVQSLMRALAEQTSEMDQIVTRAAMDAANRPADRVEKLDAWANDAGESSQPAASVSTLVRPNRTLDIKSLADRVFGDEDKAEAWLHRPNATLSGQRPIDLLKDEPGAAVVREMLERIDHGIFA
jgi:uncharacterized protein (DUF2384 family)